MLVGNDPKIDEHFFQVAEPSLGIGDEIKPLCSMEYLPPFNHEFKAKHVCMLKQSPWKMPDLPTWMVYFHGKCR